MTTFTDTTAILAAQPRAGFVETPAIHQLTERALAYVAAGYPVHFRGPSGSGKTTMALHVAHLLAQPVMLMCGDDEFGSSDLIGGQQGYHRRKVIDNFVHTVLKTEEDMAVRWVDNRLTVACREGFTLVYDEFTRSRPEANNVLLAVLEEKLLVLPATRNAASYIKVHPDFVALFTSNPEDYAGVHKTQDALLDRMVTIDMDYFDRETEVAITRSRSGVDTMDAERIVNLIRAFRAANTTGTQPTVRSCIMIARVVALRQIHAVASDPLFEQTCLDVLAAPRGVNTTHHISTRRAMIIDLVQQECGAPRPEIMRHHEHHEPEREIARVH